jgi:hypothetical protein
MLSWATGSHTGTRESKGSSQANNQVDEPKRLREEVSFVHQNQQLLGLINLLDVLFQIRAAVGGHQRVNNLAHQNPH